MSLVQASARPALLRHDGLRKAAVCGSRCRPRRRPISTTCCSAGHTRGCAMPPPDGTAEVRRIIDMGEEIKPRLQPLTAAEFLALELPMRELILNPWLPTK